MQTTNQSWREERGTGTELAVANAPRLNLHWAEYTSEAVALGLSMLSACAFSVLLDHPGSSLHQAIDSPFLRRVIGGIAIGATAIGLISSPFGKLSGAHMNPGISLTYWLLGKMRGIDAILYGIFQFVGGIAGVGLASLLIGMPLSHSAVNYAVTAPGDAGAITAFIAELIISFAMMSVVLVVSNHRDLSRFTPYFAGVLAATFFAFEAPLSGMSMNPARTFGSAFAARDWTALWIYFTAPPLAMSVAGVLYAKARGGHRVFCAKLHHHNDKRCIFRCNYSSL